MKQLFEVRYKSSCFIYVCLVKDMDGSQNLAKNNPQFYQLKFLALDSGPHVTLYLISASSKLLVSFHTMKYIRVHMVKWRLWVHLNGWHFEPKVVACVNLKMQISSSCFCFCCCRTQIVVLCRAWHGPKVENSRQFFFSSEKELFWSFDPTKFLPPPFCSFHVSLSFSRKRKRLEWELHNVGLFKRICSD